MRAIGLASASLVMITLMVSDADAASNRWCVRSPPSAARTAVMRRSISAEPRCWDSGGGADRIRSPARRSGPAAPGRPVCHARTEVGIRNQAAGKLPTKPPTEGAHPVAGTSVRANA
jgi:hypothetical protein